MRGPTPFPTRARKDDGRIAARYNVSGPVHRGRRTSPRATAGARPTVRRPCKARFRGTARPTSVHQAFPMGEVAPRMADIISRMEGDLGGEWEKHKLDIMNVLDYLRKNVSEAVDVTAGFDVGVVKLTIQVQLNRSSSSNPP